MDELEKLSCKEEICDVSDMEHSATDDHKVTEGKIKKRRRRRREIDLISEDDETEDDDIPKKMYRRISPGPGPISPASHREPRTCVLKHVIFQASQKRKPLSRLLEQLLRNLEKRDPNQFFAWPVNDNFAPGYSTIIKKPMDFSTMKQKIDDNEYKSLNCFISDFKLMCNNAMKYNKPGTVYHKAAKRLLHAGLKQLTPQKLRPLGDILTYMYEIPLRELGFDIGKMDVPLRTYGRKHKVLKRSSPVKSGGEEEAASDGGEVGDGGGDGVKIQMEAAREQHRRRLAKKAFPRMDAEGKTTLKLVTHTVDGSGEDKPLTLGQYIGKLTQGTGSLHIPREDRRNIAKCVRPLHYGPFSSYAPSYDGTFATLSKEESHLVLHTLPYETGQGNEEMLRFAPDSPWQHIYDMELLFPDKRNRPETPPPRDESQELSKVKIDIDELRSLSSLGIDVDFLNELEMATKDYGLGPALKHTYGLLAALEKEQRERLSASSPWHLSLVAGAGQAEREAARAAAGWLRAMVARVPPKEVATHAALRNAMGVTLEHLDTPLAVDDFEELHEPRDSSDRDSRSSRDK
ncbi:bromodomain-containing protein 7-like isoform X1 [Danaus plexippus]|uniref:bromodomain-containing protein 7-like isoform X1 n=1 Tax=Danaus plexippus TaxID=13037 RepID=UPI002AB2810D|nr:bromodomain-containing protein 7-like isoform X1 [Danaus plexippus]